MLRTISFTTATAVAMLLCTGAFGQMGNPSGNPTVSPAGPGTMRAPMPATPSPAMPSQPQSAPATPVNLSSEDRAFLEKATSGGLTEVEEAQIAQDKAKNDEVKSFAQQLMTDQSTADTKLKSIADAGGVQPPASPDAAQQKQIAALRKLQGDAFDKRYVQEQVAAHKATLVLFEQEAKSGSDQQLRQFASDTLPKIQQHLSDAEKLTGHNMR